MIDVLVWRLDGLADCHHELAGRQSGGMKTTRPLRHTAFGEIQGISRKIRCHFESETRKNNSLRHFRDLTKARNAADTEVR